MIRDVKDIGEFLASGDAAGLTVKVAPPEGVVGAVKIREGRLIVRDGYALPVVGDKTSTAYFGERHASKYAPLLESAAAPKAKIEHAVFIASHTNYFHFLAYHCVALYLLKTMPTKDRVTIATVNGFPPYAASLMARLLPIFSEARAVEIVTLTDGSYGLNDVVVPYRPAAPMAVVLGRQIILPLVLQGAALGDPLRELGALKLFLRREAGINGRNLSNQREVEAWFVTRGYTAVNPGAMTIDEQVILFARATHIAGVEGAAFTNILFAVNARQILALTSPLVAGETFFASLAKASNAAFTMLYGEVPAARAADRTADFYFPIAALERIDGAVIG